LDRINNIDIEQDAQDSVTALNTFLAQFDETVKNQPHPEIALFSYVSFLFNRNQIK
jgi:hypothetical protein